MWSILGIAVLFMLLTAYRFERLSYMNYLQNVRADTHLDMVDLREDIEAVIHSQSLVLHNLGAFLSENPDMTKILAVWMHRSSTSPQRLIRWCRWCILLRGTKLP